VLKLQLDPSTNITRGTASATADADTAAATTDGGETDADGGDSDGRYQPPASDHSHGANAQRAARVLLERERDGQPAPTRPELMNELSNRHEHINHETASAAIERAVETGHITEKGGKLELL
jgi:hypothetical protein